MHIISENNLRAESQKAYVTVGSITHRYYPMKKVDYMDTVLIQSLKDKKSSEGLKNLLESAKMMHWLDAINNKNKVIIKPNLCYIAPWESGVTTNVKLVEYLINFLGQQNPNFQIFIVESDSNLFKSC